MTALPKIYPLVARIDHPTVFQRDAFAAGGPRGATIHYTAGGTVDGAIRSFADTGFCYHFVIGRDGAVIQTAYCDKGVWHAGNAKWNGRSPNRTHIAIALVGWGYVTGTPATGFKSYAGTKLAAADCAHRPSNVDGHFLWWHKASDAQEKALDRLLRWAMPYGIAPADVCGHDEAALPKGRKADPGGMLSCTMPELRKRLAKPKALAPEASAPET